VQTCSKFQHLPNSGANFSAYKAKLSHLLKLTLRMQKLPDILNVSESALNCRSYLWPIILAIVARIYLLGSPTLEIDLNI
jgi:hypothetical protein